MEDNQTGYSTDYYGDLSISPALRDDERALLNRFFDVRHGDYDANKIMTEDEEWGEHLLWGEHVDEFGRNRVAPDDAMNERCFSGKSSWYGPTSLPSLWCDLFITQDGGAIRWNGEEKTSSLPEWIQFVCDVLAGWGIRGERAAGMVRKAPERRRSDLRPERAGEHRKLLENSSQNAAANIDRSPSGLLPVRACRFFMQALAGASMQKEGAAALASHRPDEPAVGTGYGCPTTRGCR